MPKRVAAALMREAVGRFLGELPAPQTRRLWDAGERGLVLVASKGCATASWFVSYRTREGRKRLVRVADAGAKLADVRKAARLVKGEVTTGGDPLEARRAARTVGVTVAQGWAAYQEEGRGRWKPTTAATYADQARRMIVPELGGKLLAGLKPAEVAAWHRAMTERHGKTTANRVAALLKAVWNAWARREGVAARNPVSGLEFHEEGRRQRFVTLGEMAALWRAVDRLESKGPAAALKRSGVASGRGGRGMAEVEARGFSKGQAAFWRLAMVTACRVGELKALEWGDWRPEESVLVLRDSKVGARRVLVPEVGAAALEALGRRAAGPVFAGADGRALVDIRKGWRRLCREAGVAGCVPHGIRHGCATLMIEAGATVLDVARVLGHRVELRGAATGIYLHVNEAGARAALEAGVAALLAEVARQEAAAKGEGSGPAVAVAGQLAGVGVGDA